jgi:N-methylhydantoinase B
VIRVSTPGGGGYGDPLRRDPARVARDVMRGYYSREEAEQLFGVRWRPDGSAYRPD